MPEFLLRYKVPQDLDWDDQVEDVRLHAQKIADRVRAKASEIFFGWNVEYEVREFEDNEGMSDFVVTGWITDNDDKFVEITLQAQRDLLALMQSLAFEDQGVECSWQRIKGKWGRAQGMKKRK